jgi:hypothetical protein
MHNIRNNVRTGGPAIQKTGRAGSSCMRSGRVRARQPRMRDVLADVTRYEGSLSGFQGSDASLQAPEPPRHLKPARDSG